MEKSNLMLNNIAFFKKLIDHCQEGISLINKDHIIIYRTSSSKRIYGYETLDKTNNDILELIHPDDVATVSEALKRVHELPGEPITISCRSRHADGHYLWSKCTLTNMFDDPDINAIICYCINITPQKESEELLQRSLQEGLNKTTQINNLLESITDGFISLDENHRYTYANQQIGKMLGIDTKELIGKDIWSIFPDAVGSETYKAIEQAYAEETYVCNEDYFPPLSLWQENRIYPSGKGLSIFIRDISTRKNDEIEKSILAAIRQIFNTQSDLSTSLEDVLAHLVKHANFNLAEAWLIEADRKKINLVAKFDPKMGSVFSDDQTSRKVFKKGEGLPGITWKEKKLQFWKNIDTHELLLRKNTPEMEGLKSAYGIPIFNNSKIIGVLILASSFNYKQAHRLPKSLDTIGSLLGSEIKRKQLEQELNQVFRFTPDILCIANTDGYFKKVNPAMSLLLEYSEHELLSRPILDFVHPLDREETATEVKNSNEGNLTYYIENRYITKSGKVKWLAWTTTGASSGVWYGSAKDITDKKELQELFNKANSLARIGGWELNLLDNTVYWSDITREIHETEPDYVPDIKGAINFYKKGRNRNRITKKLKSVIQDGIIWDEELEIITAKGNPKWVRVIAEAEFLDDRCIRVHGSFQDINTLKSAEIRAKEVLEERNTILESIADAFFAVDKNWMVTYWNNSAAKVLHRSKEEVLHHYLWDVFSNSIDSLSYVKYHEAIALNQPMHFEDHYPQLHKWYEISAYPSKAGLSVYFKDITERKISELLLNNLNVSLHQQAKELSDSNAELEQFAYVASHDLQEPLRMVTSFLTQLELKYGDIIDERGKKYIYFAVDGAKRMRQIILDLLEYSRVGRFEAEAEEIQISDIIDDILILFRKEIEEQEAIITFTKMPTIISYKAPIRQLFQNLISNGLKYKDPNRKVRIAITTDETDTHYQFTITDNGIGIAQDYYEKIFVIFQRLHNKDEYSGTGMGLAIAKKIVENLGGTISVESKLGEGTTFNFTIEKKLP